MTTNMSQRVVLRPFGQDRHGEGCDCGACNAIGKSYGVAIYAARDDADLEGDDYYHDDPLDVAYDRSEDSANDLAREICEQKGWEVVEPADEVLAIVEMQIAFWGTDDQPTQPIGTRWIAVTNALSLPQAERALQTATKSEPKARFRVCTDYGHVRLLPGHTCHIEVGDGWKDL